MFGRRMAARWGRPLLRGAVVGGAAYYAGRRAAQHEADQDAALEEMRADTAPPASGAGGIVDQLSQLAALHAQGLLRDDEFEAAKARLLAV